MNKKNPAASETTRRTRRVLDEAFKTKVVLDAFKDTLTVNELASNTMSIPSKSVSGKPIS